MSTPPPIDVSISWYYRYRNSNCPFERPEGMKPKVLATIAVWTICVGALAFALLQMQTYAGLINNAGVIRGGAQQAVKLALADKPNDAIVARINGLLEKLESQERSRLIKDPSSEEFLKDLELVKGTWTFINQEFADIAQGGGSRERLIALSEDHFKQADAMVLSAQHRAERDLLGTIILSLALVIAVTSAVAIREHRFQQARQAALETDPLTGSRDLAAFERQAHDLAQNADPRGYVVVHTNLENFRMINESFGRPAGDRAINVLNNLFEQSCKEGELAAHANADHFALLLHNSDQRVERLAARVQAQLKADDTLPFSDRITCGYGVYEMADGNEDIATALSNAAVVLKEGSESNLIARYDDEFRSKLAFEQNVMQLMKKALEHEEFAPYLQTQTSLISGKLVGGEMLCRWNSPELGFLSPDRFIPQFERNGFIAELDFYMLEQACRRRLDLGEPERGAVPFHLAVNFSRITMLQNDFEERFMRMVTHYDMPPAQLHVEVTEGAFSVDEDAVIDILTNLRERGFPIAMDDFGTGYSSLSLLRRMPIDVLKIDRGFLSASEDDIRSRQVLEYVINLAKGLDIDTVCEGIETVEQADMLRSLGCEIAQGYYFARPVLFDDFVENRRSTRA